MSELPDSLKYSKWDHIEVSDDEGDSHPNIDQKLMARLKKEKRARDYEEFRQKHPDAPDPIRAEELQDASNRCVVNSSNRETPAQKEAKLAKETGNKHFSKEEYKEAVEWFTKAVELAKPDCEGGGSEARKQLAVYYNNRAAAHWNLLMHDEAIADTTAAIKLDPRYVKARLCRAKVYEARKDVKAAYDDYKRAMSYEPSNSTASDGLKRLQPEMDKLAEEKLIEIKIPDEIPENRTIKYNVPGHGWIELELPEDAQPGQTIRLQLEEEEQEPEEEGGGGGLHRHADLYQKSLDTYFKDPVLSKIFSERWGKMQYEARLAVIDRTFDAMVQQTINNTTGYKMSKKDLFLLCPEVSPANRQKMAREPAHFVQVCKTAIADTDEKAEKWLRDSTQSLKETQIAFGMKLQYEISVDTDGGIEVMAPIRRLLVAETFVCVFEALTGKKASEMEHMRNM